MRGRSRLLVAGLTGMLLAATLLLANAGNNVDRMTFGDGVLYRYVATHLTTPAHDVDQVIVDRGTSLRYGRIGLPAAIWLASAGHASAARYAQPAIMVLCAGAVTAAAAALLPGAPHIAALIVWLAVGFPLAVAGGYAEALALAFGLWGISLALKGRWWWSSSALAMALLTKENAAVIVAGLIIWAALRRRWTGAAVLAAAVIPCAAWYAFVSIRFGHIPILDPYLRTTGTVGLPGISIVRSLIHPYSGGSAVVAAIHIVGASAAILLARRSAFWLIALVASLQLLFAGPFAWRWIGDAMRISVFLQTAAVFSVLAWRRPTWAIPEPQWGS